MKALLFALFLTGCAGSLGAAKARGPVSPESDVAPVRAFRLVAPSAEAAAEPPPSAGPSARCISLDDRHSFWTASAMGAGVASGASGISTIPVKDQNWKIGLAVTALVAGIWSAVSTSMSSSSAESWARECSQ